MFKLIKFEFQCAIRIHYRSYTLLHLAGREIRKSELQVQFIIIASSITRQLTEILPYTDIFRAPPRAVRVIMQRKTSVTIILNAPFCERRVSNKSALSSSALHSSLRASLCSSEWQSPLFYALFWDWESALRIKVIHCHPQRSTPRSARRFAASNDSHCYSTRFLRLGERAPSISELQKFARKKKT
jgi:hypothetical protein